MDRPKILIYIHYLEIGGAERALIGLLSALDPERVEVDLLLNQHTGEFMRLIPKHVRLLPEMPEYSAIERPISQIVKEGHFGIALRRLMSKYRYRKYQKSLSLDPSKVDESIFQYVFREVTPGLRDLSFLGEYDLAISFLHPHNIVLQKVRAKRKVCWIHTDYSTVHVDHSLELPIWSGYDLITSISDEAARSFAETFPTLRDRIITIENILSPAMVRSEAALLDVSDEMPRTDGALRFLSIGRYCPAKRFDEVPLICRRLLDRGLNFHWYIIGFGDDSEIRRNIERYDVGHVLHLLGKKQNPYPYIAACDIYVQPSRYEGKSVTVREAQIMGRPVAICAYPTAASQVTDGSDGRILPLDIEGCAYGLYSFATDTALRDSIAQHLRTHDYGNEAEVNKIYDIIDKTV